jgi:hypothetical protein
MLGSIAWAQINSVSLAAGQVVNDKALQYFNIYGHKCFNRHSFTLPGNFTYNIKQRPDAIHVLFTNTLLITQGQQKGYAVWVGAMLPTLKLTCTR